MAECENCNDLGWVCENHDSVPWDGSETCCGGAGTPCRYCNCDPADKTATPRPLPGSIEVWNIYDD